MRNSFLTLAGISVLFFVGCKSKVPATGDLISDNVNNAVEQYSLMTNQIEKSGQVLNPRTLDKDGKTVYVPYRDWTSGFFPGSMWYYIILHKIKNGKHWL